jgi:NADPH-ferrihemoprotein reductase
MFFFRSHSIEEDFVTWKENLWPTVCQRFGIDGSEQAGIVREYELTIHENMVPERVFSGEPHRLGAYHNQKP